MDSKGEAENCIWAIVRCCGLYMVSFLTKLNGILTSIRAILRLYLKIFVVLLAIAFLNIINS